MCFIDLFVWSTLKKMVVKPFFLKWTLKFASIDIRGMMIHFKDLIHIIIWG